MFISSVALGNEISRSIVGVLEKAPSLFLFKDTNFLGAQIQSNIKSPRLL